MTTTSPDLDLVVDIVNMAEVPSSHKTPISDVQANEIVGFGAGGSHLYGLNTVTSDFDTVVVVDRPDLTNEYHKVLSNEYALGGEYDLWVIPTERFVQGISGSKPNYVDLMESVTMEWDYEHPMYPMVSSATWNPLPYLDSLGRTTKAHLNEFAEAATLMDRDIKKLKTAWRNICVSTKMLRYSYGEEDFFNPAFSDKQRKFFYQVLGEAISQPRAYDFMDAWLNYQAGNLPKEED